uniref:Glycine rich superfamily member n=1 Tax=Rhipicephalus appendiculatus TaxID=34631 RepID=A0A131Z5N0_RHIAP
MTAFAPIALLFAAPLAIVIGTVEVGGSIASMGGLGGGGLAGPVQSGNDGYPNLGAPVSPGSSYPGGSPSAPSGFPVFSSPSNSPSSRYWDGSLSTPAHNGYGGSSGVDGFGYGGYYGDGFASYGGHDSRPGYGSGYNFGYGSGGYGGPSLSFSGQ